MIGGVHVGILVIKTLMISSLMLEDALGQYFKVFIVDGQEKWVWGVVVFLISIVIGDVVVFVNEMIHIILFIKLFLHVEFIRDWFKLWIGDGVKKPLIFLGFFLGSE